MVSRVGVWIMEILFVLTQRVGVGEHLSEEVRIMSGVLQRSVLSPLLFLAHVIDISRNILSTIRLFADDSKIQKNYK
jgi:flagellar basal body rod protein FlgF